MLTVGRLETEKNPLLLADVLAQLRERPALPAAGLRRGADGGGLRGAWRSWAWRTRADLLGYVPINDGLLEVYRSSHAFLHVSWTEGLPQTLFEAFAARPVVATAVGGVPAAVGDSALLVEPGDAGRAGRELCASRDPALRRRSDRGPGWSACATTPWRPRAGGWGLLPGSLEAPAERPGQAALATAAGRSMRRLEPGGVRSLCR